MSRDAKVRSAVVLVSGGLDSATVLAIAQQEGFRCHALTVDYGQRHVAELDAARRVVAAQDVAQHRFIKVDFGQFGGSALTDSDIAVPTGADGPGSEIPVTYVPARNTVFLALALGWAEVLGATDIFIGANAVDYSGYPDCRPEFIEQFARLAKVATRAGVQGAEFAIHAPLIELKKSEIIRRGQALGVDYGPTLSCYDPDPSTGPCGRCDACRLRAKGFLEAGVPAPALEPQKA